MTNERSENTNNLDRRRTIDALALILGAGLIGFGALTLLGQLVDIRLGRYLWPLLILGPGVLAYLLALVLESPAGEIICVPASITTMLGLLLFYQNLAHHWESWAYAWALITPTSIGAGYWIFGLLRRRPDKIHIGKGLTKIGGAIFLVGFIFFELLLDISGFGLSRWAWPVLLLVLGAYLVLRTLRRRAH